MSLDFIQEKYPCFSPQKQVQISHLYHPQPNTCEKNDAPPHPEVTHHGLEEKPNRKNQVCKPLEKATIPTTFVQSQAFPQLIVSIFTGGIQAQAKEQRDA